MIQFHIYMDVDMLEVDEFLEQVDDINISEYDADTNWDNWDLEPNVKVRKKKGSFKRYCRSNNFNRFCISRTNQPVCKKVKRKKQGLVKLLNNLSI